jgi:hypothetical protein
MNRAVASDGFAADIRFEFAPKISLGAKRIGLSAECLELGEGCTSRDVMIRIAAIAYASWERKPLP